MDNYIRGGHFGHRLYLILTTDSTGGYVLNLYLDFWGTSMENFLTIKLSKISLYRLVPSPTHRSLGYHTWSKRKIIICCIFYKKITRKTVVETRHYQAPKNDIYLSYMSYNYIYMSYTILHRYRSQRVRITCARVSAIPRQ